MLASGSRKGHRGEEGEAAVERKAVLGGRGALACGRGRGRGARFTGSLDLQKARGLENGPLPKRIPPFDDFLMSCDRVTTQRTQRNAIIVTTCPQSTLRPCFYGFQCALATWYLGSRFTRRKQGPSDPCFYGLGKNRTLVFAASLGS
jgi:hypothetical protein